MKFVEQSCSYVTFLRKAHGFRFYKQNLRVKLANQSVCGTRDPLLKKKNIWLNQNGIKHLRNVL